MKIYRVTIDSESVRPSYKLWKTWRSAINSAAHGGNYRRNRIDVVDVPDDMWQAINLAQERYARNAKDSFAALASADPAGARQLLDELAALIRQQTAASRVDVILEEDARQEVKLLLGTTFGT